MIRPRPILDATVPFILGQIRTGTRSQPRGAGNGIFGPMFNVGDLFDFGWFENLTKVMTEKASFDHDDEEGEDDPISNGGVEENVLGIEPGG
mmetsp:Transcript_9268/g.13866  ORF Transcript_9268/g.13866 Transcript_9268/m.13866 type:complete len:92 (-) Transcript_9268:162-437(-)